MKINTTNHLNQYTSISSDSQKSSSSSGSFAPVFDTDGNQTTIKTSTGEWLVEYNGENRPIKFTQGNKVIEMSYDYMGRRVEYISSENDVVNQHAKFVYNDYVLVQELSNANILLKEFVWDPTAGQATTPLVFKLVQNNEMFFYTQDANKNIAELVFSDTTKGVADHYEYDAFGAIVATNSSLSISNTPAENIASLNPFKFSSEYHDSPLGLVYYNYRHYNPNDGRWLSRDPIAEKGGYNLYSTCNNNLINVVDKNGLWSISFSFTFSAYAISGPIISFGLSFSYSKEKGFSIGSFETAGGGITTDVGASATFDISANPDAKHISDNAGNYIYTGFAGGKGITGGTGISISPLGNCGNGNVSYSANIGLSTPSPSPIIANETVYTGITIVHEWWNIGGDRNKITTTIETSIPITIPSQGQ